MMPTPINISANGLAKRHGSSRKGNWRGCWRLLCLLFSISVAACLLSRSGDVESNPGPPECEWIEVKYRLYQEGEVSMQFTLPRAAGPRWCKSRRN